MNYVGTFTLGDITVFYPRDEDGRVGLWLIPTSKVQQMVPHRPFLRGHEVDKLDFDTKNIPAATIDSLVQFKIRSEGEAPQFTSGTSLRNSPSLAKLRLDRQEVRRDGATTEIITRVVREDGLAAAHHLQWQQGWPYVRVWTEVTNGTRNSQVLEMLASFSIGGITPFHDADAPERLLVHRFRSAWSAEGRLVSEPIEQLHLERTWINAGARCERFGQVGSIPTSHFFPQALIEDTAAKVTWGAALAWAGSWQLELYRQDDWLNFSGGLADREFGHWTRTLDPGESLATPPAVLTVAADSDVDATCQRLTSAQVPAVEAQPAIERDLPICFNEWCTSWGKPTHENLLRLADRLQGSGITYLVMDAGWYTDDPNWFVRHGDWEVSLGRFPQGLPATAEAIRQRGLIPGIWFEMENAGADAQMYMAEDCLLRRDRVVLTVGPRRFLDLNNPRSRQHIDERMIGLLERCGFGYLKVDYNASIGLGCDHPDGLGEGLRQHIGRVYDLFAHIRRRLPNLVIENCSSGGHRLEPSMQGLCAVGSFSDAHESMEIPIIAANLHRLILPRQSLVWSVLRADDSPQRLAYSLAATFLGRMCLSGDAHALSNDQWRRVLEAIELYKQVAHIIRDGQSRRFGPALQSWRHPKGWQGMLRIHGEEALAVLHSFGEPLTDRMCISLPPGQWAIEQTFPADAAASVEGSTLLWNAPGPFSAAVFHLYRRNKS